MRRELLLSVLRIEKIRHFIEIFLKTKAEIALQLLKILYDKYAKIREISFSGK